MKRLGVLRFFHFFLLVLLLLLLLLHLFLRMFRGLRTKNHATIDDDYGHRNAPVGRTNLS